MAVGCVECERLRAELAALRRDVAVSEHGWRDLGLTAQQAAVLDVLVRTDGIAPTERILTALERVGRHEVTHHKTPHVRVSQLRKALGVRIDNVPGVGYCMSRADARRLRERVAA